MIFEGVIGFPQLVRFLVQSFTRRVLPPYHSHFPNPLHIRSGFDLGQKSNKFQFPICFPPFATCLKLNSTQLKFRFPCKLNSNWQAWLPPVLHRHNLLSAHYDYPLSGIDSLVIFFVKLYSQILKSVVFRVMCNRKWTNFERFRSELLS